MSDFPTRGTCQICRGSEGVDRVGLDSGLPSYRHCPKRYRRLTDWKHGFLPTDWWATMKAIVMEKHGKPPDCPGNDVLIVSNEKELSSSSTG